MKKLILLLFIPLVFTCSSDSSDGDSNNPIQNDKKPVTITFEHPICGGDGITHIFTFLYSGDKIISGTQEQFYYISGSNCSEVDPMFNTSFTNVYSDEKLVSTNVIRPNYTGSSWKNYMTTYEYNSYGLITTLTRQYYDTDGVEYNTGANKTLTYNWTNNNLTRQTLDEQGNLIAIDNYDSNYNSIETINYVNGSQYSVSDGTFDLNKFDPFINTHQDYLWYSLDVVGKRGSNPQISRTNTYLTDNSVVDNLFDNIYDEDNFLIQSDRTRSDQSSYLRIMRFYYE